MTTQQYLRLDELGSIATPNEDELAEYIVLAAKAEHEHEHDRMENASNGAEYYGGDYDDVF